MSLREATYKLFRKPNSIQNYIHPKSIEPPKFHKDFEQMLTTVKLNLYVLLFLLVFKMLILFTIINSGYNFISIVYVYLISKKKQL